MGSHPSSAHDPRRQHPRVRPARSSPHLSWPSHPDSPLDALPSTHITGWARSPRSSLGNSSDDLEWLEAATTALGAQVIYMAIRRSDNRTAERERQLAMADAMSDVAYADEQAKAADAIIAGVSQHATDRELRRIVGEGRTLRRRGLDRDLELTDQYVTHGSVDQAIVTERAADRRRYEELRDEYLLMNGGEPTTWPL